MLSKAPQEYIDTEKKWKGEKLYSISLQKEEKRRLVKIG